MRSEPAYDIRVAQECDAPILHEIEREAWGDDAASPSTLLSRVIASHCDTVIVSQTGSPRDSKHDIAFAQVIWISPEQLSGPLTWKKVAEMGVSSSRGIAYGINLSARPTATGMGRLALQAVLGLVVHRGGTHFFAGGRMPGYAHWPERLSPDVYASMYQHAGRFYSLRGNEVQAVDADGSVTPDNTDWDKVRRDGRAVDPFVRMVLDTQVLGQRCEILGTIPDYFEDASSRNFGLLYCWRNPFVRKAQADPVVSAILRATCKANM